MKSVCPLTDGYIKKSNNILKRFYGTEVYNNYNHELLRFHLERYRVANEKGKAKILKSIERERL